VQVCQRSSDRLLYHVFGLAGVLIIIGILLVRSLVERFGGSGNSSISSLSRALPLFSAVIVTPVGRGDYARLLVLHDRGPG